MLLLLLTAGALLAYLILLDRNDRKRRGRKHRG